MAEQMLADLDGRRNRWWKPLCALLLTAGGLVAAVVSEYDMVGTDLRSQLHRISGVVAYHDTWQAEEAHGRVAQARETISRQWPPGALVPLADFCPNHTRCVPDPGRKPCHAVFRRGVVLHNMSMVVPEGALECGSIPLEWGKGSLRTRFNAGRGSTPELPTFVLIGTQGLEDLPPQLQCQVTVQEPSVFASLIHWVQYGHNMFNGISLLYDMFTDPQTGLQLQPPLAGPDAPPLPSPSPSPSTRLFLFQDRYYRPWDPSFGANYTRQLDVHPYEEVLRMFTGGKVESLGWLLYESLNTPTCFGHLVAGLSGELDHYNFDLPREAWLGFAEAVRRHLGVGEPLRDPMRESAPLVAHPLIGCIGLPRSSASWRAPAAHVVEWGRAGEGRPRLVLLQRSDSRRIANAEEVLEVAKGLGLFASVEMVNFEGMAVEEQIRFMGKTDVLLGMDGTGLMNGIFMPLGGVVIHLRPYGCLKYLMTKGQNFQRLWLGSPGHVISYENADPETGFYPESQDGRPHVRLPKDLKKLDDLKWLQMTAVLAQDTVVRPQAAKCLVEASFQLLEGRHVDWKAIDECSDNVLARMSSCPEREH